MNFRRDLSLAAWVAAIFVGATACLYAVSFKASETMLRKLADVTPEAPPAPVRIPQPPEPLPLPPCDNPPREEDFQFCVVFLDDLTYKDDEELFSGSVTEAITGRVGSLERLVSAFERRMAGETDYRELLKGFRAMLVLYGNLPETEEGRSLEPRLLAAVFRTHWRILSVQPTRPEETTAAGGLGKVLYFMGKRGFPRGMTGDGLRTVKESIIAFPYREYWEARIRSLREESGRNALLSLEGRDDEIPTFQRRSFFDTWVTRPIHLYDQHRALRVLDSVRTRYGSCYVDFLGATQFPEWSRQDLWVSELWRALAYSERLSMARGQTVVSMIHAAMDIEAAAGTGEDSSLAESIAAGYVDDFYGEPLNYTRDGDRHRLSCRVCDRHGECFTTMTHEW